MCICGVSTWNFAWHKFGGLIPQGVFGGGSAEAQVPYRIRHLCHHYLSLACNTKAIHTGANVVNAIHLTECLKGFPTRAHNYIMPFILWDGNLTGVQPIWLLAPLLCTLHFGVPVSSAAPELCADDLKRVPSPRH